MADLDESLFIPDPEPATKSRVTGLAPNNSGQLSILNDEFSKLQAQLSGETDPIKRGRLLGDYAALSRELARHGVQVPPVAAAGTPAPFDESQFVEDATQPQAAPAEENLDVLDKAAIAGRGFVHGATAGLDQYVGAGYNELENYLTGNGGPQNDFSANLAKVRMKNAQLAEQHPWLWNGGQLVGGGALALGTGGTSLAAMAGTGAAIGAMNGLNQKLDPTDPRTYGTATEDAAIGGTIGGVLGAAGKVLPAAQQAWIRSAMKQRYENLATQFGEQAAEAAANGATSTAKMLSTSAAGASSMAKRTATMTADELQEFARNPVRGLPAELAGKSGQVVSAVGQTTLPEIVQGTVLASKGLGSLAAAPARIRDAVADYSKTAAQNVAAKVPFEAVSSTSQAAAGATIPGAVETTSRVVNPMTYDQYLAAFDAEPDPDKKVALGYQYAASLKARPPVSQLDESQFTPDK
jgi:hypothetical protein